MAPDDRFDRALVLSRRVGVVVGLLFGLGLVTLVVADRAAADEQGSSADVAAPHGVASVVGGLGRLTEPLTRPVADTVKPVAAAVVEPVAPVVRAGTDVLAPVVGPVVEAVAPVTAPVLRPVVAAVTPVLAPVLDAAAPVAGPLLSPVLDAAEPVVTPVTDATGLADVTDAVSGARSQAEPAAVDESLPALSTTPSIVPSMASSATRSVVHDVTPSSPGVAPVALVHSGPNMTPGMPGPRPGLPTAPVPFAVSGGGVAGGMGSAHGGDAAVVGGSGGVVGQWSSSGRSPPGTIVGTAWFGYDDRDHPS